MNLSEGVGAAGSGQVYACAESQGGQTRSLSESGAPLGHRQADGSWLYLGRYANHLIILDEIQQMPDLFPVLRSLVDERRQPPFPRPRVRLNVSFRSLPQKVNS